MSDKLKAASPLKSDTLDHYNEKDVHTIIYMVASCLCVGVATIEEVGTFVN